MARTGLRGVGCQVGWGAARWAAQGCEERGSPVGKYGVRDGAGGADALSQIIG